MGQMQVPADAYYGAQTARAVENFPISDLRFPRAFIRALAMIKGAAAAVNQLKAYIATVQDPRQRVALDRALRRLELQVGPVGPVQPDAAARPGATPVSAAAVVTSTPAAPQVDPAVVDDPNAAYTHEVSAAIIDAMIENSGSLPVADNEWLTVAARDNIRPDRLVPGDMSNISSIVFRIKGSDLAAFRAGRMTLEEARTHVEVKQF